MLVFKLGRESQPIDIISLLKKEHEQEQEYNKNAIEERKKAGIPLSDAEQRELTLTDFDEKKLNHFKDLRVTFKAVSTLEVLQVQSKINKALEVKDMVRTEIEGNKAIVEFLKKAVVKIEGFKDGETDADIPPEFNDEMATILIESRCLMAVYRACRIWQELSALEKKTLEQLLP